MTVNRPNPIRVLFVCLGNICRSPMAEAVFAHKVDLAGLSHAIQADSCGTGGWHVGEAPHPGTRRVLSQKGIRYAGRARAIHPNDLAEFHYLVAMDRDNHADIARLGETEAERTLLLDYAPRFGLVDVPDPWYDGRFELVYELVEEATENLLEAIRVDHGL